MDAVNGTSSPAPSRPPSSAPFRDDCWSEDATFTLIHAWGRHYLELNRGSLRHKHWQEVADAVNDRHFNASGGTSSSSAGAKIRPHRTDVQCKNRMDTLKKKYKIEKARVSNGGYIGTWPFFSALENLLRENSPLVGTPDSADNRRMTSLMGINAFPVAPRSAISRRPAAVPTVLSLACEEPSSFRGSISAIVAAAAAAACPPSEDDSDGSRSRSSSRSGSNRKRRREGERNEGCTEVANAIERLGQIYERVEEKKRREMVELEKQRMRFATELECHRMQLFTEMQVRLHKLKPVDRSKGSSSSDVVSAAAAAGKTFHHSSP